MLQCPAATKRELNSAMTPAALAPPESWASRPALEKNQDAYIDNRGRRTKGWSMSRTTLAAPDKTGTTHGFRSNVGRPGRYVGQLHEDLADIVMGTDPDDSEWNAIEQAEAIRVAL